MFVSHHKAIPEENQYLQPLIHLKINAFLHNEIKRSIGNTCESLTSVFASPSDR